jgi:hypothetical protein
MTVVFKGPHDLVAGYGIRVEINLKSEVGILHLVSKSDNVLVFTQLIEDLDNPGQGHEYEALYHKRSAAFLTNAGPQSRVAGKLLPTITAIASPL